MIAAMPSDTLDRGAMSTKTTGQAKEHRALSAFIQLARAAESVAAEIQPALAESQLTAGQLGVLDALLHGGSMSLRELGQRVFRSAPNMTTVIDNLERARLVRRARSEEDRRVVVVSMTSEGKQRIGQAFPPYARSITEYMSGITQDEQDELTRLCMKLRQRFQVGAAARRDAAASRRAEKRLS